MNPISKHFAAAALVLALAASSLVAGTVSAESGLLKTAGTGPLAGPVIPVVDADGLLWLCREDDDAQQSICIPWFQDEDSVKTLDKLMANGATAQGPVVPAVDADGLLWLCREDDDAQQSICIPWFQELKQPANANLRVEDAHRR